MTPVGCGLRFDATSLPVPADTLVCPLQEWEKADSPIVARVRREMVWVA